MDKQRIGKLYYVVTLSRWQEAAANKKYDAVLSENKELRKEYLNTEQLYQNMEYQYHEAENLLQERQLSINKLKQDLSNQTNQYMTLEKGEELNNIIRTISDEKTDLEESYFKMRSEYLANVLRLDEALAKADHANDILDSLRGTQTQIGDKLMEMSENQSKLRLSELRSTRECNELKEKHNYLSRLLKQ